MKQVGKSLCSSDERPEGYVQPGWDRDVAVENDASLTDRDGGELEILMNKKPGDSNDTNSDEKTEDNCSSREMFHD
jgi:hypothetical protein